MGRLDVDTEPVDDADGEEEYAVIFVVVASSFILSEMSPDCTTLFAAPPSPPAPAPAPAPLPQLVLLETRYRVLGDAPRSISGDAAAAASPIIEATKVDRRLAAAAAADAADADADAAADDDDDADDVDTAPPPAIQPPRSPRCLLFDGVIKP
mgnify:CR=1 FL=1